MSRHAAAGASLTDLVLSSGFLAFAAQAGFLKGVEERGEEVGGLCGTSSGALAGALWASGWPADRIYEQLCGQLPLHFLRPHLAMWRGLLSLRAVVEQLRIDLPPTFADLERPLGIGVVDNGRPRLVTTGDLPLAVAASCAIPYVFAPIRREGRVLSDGGALDRTALDAWRRHRPERPILLHLVERSSGAQGALDLTDVRVVRSPRSRAQLWRMGDTGARFERARHAVQDVG